MGLRLAFASVLHRLRLRPSDRNHNLCASVAARLVDGGTSYPRQGYFGPYGKSFFRKSIAFLCNTAQMAIKNCTTLASWSEIHYTRHY